MLIAAFATGSLQANCYLLAAQQGSKLVVIDPGEGAAPVVEAELDSRSMSLAAVLLTHGHLDHCCDAVRLAQRHAAPIYCGIEDWPMLRDPMVGLAAEFEAYAAALTGGSMRLPEPDELRDLEPGKVEIAGLAFDILPAPGHSPGSRVLSLTIAEQPLAFTGDVIFAGSIGRTDLPGGDAHQMRATVDYLREQIAPDTTLLPGHGPATTMSQELLVNPYLR